MTLAQAPASLRAAVRTALAGGTSPPPGWGSTELTRPSDASGTFAWSVAISGSTAVVGTDGGQAYIFGRSGAGWTEEAKLTGSDFTFGSAVATNGSTVAVGSPSVTSKEKGAVFVYAQSGGSWTHQAKLTASDGKPLDDFGASLAMSGNTIVVGANYRRVGTGAAYVFTQSGGSWTQQAELTASDGAEDYAFGDAVAVSGSTVLVGSPFYGHVGDESQGTGAAYVFTSSGGSWTQQAELKASDAADGDEFGRSVAISGQTAIVGAPDRSASVGAAYVFGQSGGTWTQQAELTPSGKSANMFGVAVAIDGSTAAVGAAAPPYFTRPGAVFVYTGSGANWHNSATLHPSDQGKDGLGDSVALSGSTVIAGAPGQQGGTAYVFTDYGVPTVAGVAPVSGPLAGGNTVTINGSHFVAGLTTVDFGGVASPSVTVINSRQVQAVAPAAGSAGSVDVTVTAPGGTSKTSAKDLYAYGP
jgi:hypothetical protein